MRIAMTLLLVALATVAHANETLIRDGRIMTSSDAGVIERGDILVRDGRIIDVGAEVSVPDGATIVDANGAWITTGLFDSNTMVGLGDVESSSVRSDHRVRNSDLGAGFRISLAIDRHSLHIPITRLEGVTRALVRPSVGEEVFAGQSAILALADDDVIVSSSNAVFVYLGETSHRVAGGTRGKAMIDLIDALDEADLYAGNRRAFERRRLRDLRESQLDLEALVPVIEGDKPLAVYVDRASDIEVLIEEIAARRSGDRELDLVIMGGREAWKVADLLAEEEIPVVINALDNAPRNFDRIGARLDQAALLAQAGVTFAFMTEDLFTDNRTLNQGAGVAVANGLAWEDAIEAITINPARIRGIEDDYGSIEPGKQADIVIWNGDPLEVMSAPTRMMIRGEWVELTSRQLKLRDRYSDLENPTQKPFGYRRGRSKVPE
ncbi:MAG: amidohydrolase family protein [Gammaproteobacteria bacterium]|nr:amidohydrolase family protein [Gammaproteobacteria bacterium]